MKFRNWAVDGLIELIQKFYHKMNFKNDSLDGWMQHSPHLQLNNKAIRFATSEYSRVFSDTSKAMKFGDRSENDLISERTRRPHLFQNVYRSIWLLLKSANLTIYFSKYQVGSTVNRRSGIPCQ